MSDIPSSDRVVDFVPKDISGHTFIDDLKRRRGGELLNLDRILLHSPNFASGWNHLFGTLRGNSLLVDSKYRELAICCIAVLNKAEYEFYQHEQPWRNAGGTDEQVQAIRHANTDLFDPSKFDDLELQVIKLTIEMTKNIEVPRDLMQALQIALGDQALVELVGVISGYNMVSRFLVALDITAPDL